MVRCKCEKRSVKYTLELNEEEMGYVVDALGEAHNRDELDREGKTLYENMRYCFLHEVDSGD